MPLFSRKELLERYGRDRQKSGTRLTAREILVAESRASTSPRPYDIFLSHSFKDAELILGLRNEIVEMGFSVYVDWLEDSTLDRQNVTPATAAVLRSRMGQCAALIFATSEAAAESRWMPWELGYFDALRGKVGILPVAESPSSTDLYAGREYLGLYPYITRRPSQGINPATAWVHAQPNVYVSVGGWLRGEKPGAQR